MLAEVVQCDVACHEVASRLREHDLSAMRSGGDARRPVNVDPDVALVGGERFSGMDSNSYAQRALGQSALPLIGRFEGIGRTGEHVEECVSLRVDFGAAAFAELGAENPSMLGENPTFTFGGASALKRRKAAMYSPGRSTAE